MTTVPSGGIFSQLANEPVRSAAAELQSSSAPFARSALEGLDQPGSQGSKTLEALGFGGTAGFFSNRTFGTMMNGINEVGGGAPKGSASIAPAPSGAATGGTPPSASAAPKEATPPQQPPPSGTSPHKGSKIDLSL